MNILTIERTPIRDISTYNIGEYLKHKLKFRIVNLTYDEAESLKRSLTDYQHEWEKRHTLATTAALPTLHDRRAEVLMAECLLGNTSGDLS